MFSGGRLVDFSQSCVKTVALAYTERESWHDPACPDVPVLVFSAWCPALPCFTHHQMGTACSWRLPRQPVHFHGSLYLQKCSQRPPDKYDPVLVG